MFGDFAPGTATLTAALMSVRRRAFKNSVQCNNGPLKILCNSLFLGVKVQRTYFESHLHVLLPIILPDGQFTYSTEVLSIFVFNSQPFKDSADVFMIPDSNDSASLQNFSDLRHLQSSEDRRFCLVATKGG